MAFSSRLFEYLLTCDQAKIERLIAVKVPLGNLNRIAQTTPYRYDLSLFLVLSQSHAKQDCIARAQKHFLLKKKKWKRVAKIEILPKISCKTQVGAVTLSKTDTGVPAPTVRLRKVSDWKRHGQDLLVLWKKKLDMSINGLFLYELCLYFEVIWKGTQKFLNV